MIKIIVIDIFKVSEYFEYYKTINLIMCDSCSKIEEQITNCDILCNCDSQSYEPRLLKLELEQNIDNINIINDIEYSIEKSIKILEITHHSYECID